MFYYFLLWICYTVEANAEANHGKASYWKV